MSLIINTLKNYKYKHFDIRLVIFVISLTVLGIQVISSATDSNEYETYKKNWQAAQQVANETQDAMLAKTQEWAEAMKAIVENELTDFATTMEEQLTGGISFDEMLTSMERRSSL